jgi:hypothetical protein
MAGDGEALGWIVEVLRRADVPFQVVGGLAARAFGATRPLADLDFYVPTSRLDEIADLAAAQISRPPLSYRDECVPCSCGSGSGRSQRPNRPLQPPSAVSRGRLNSELMVTPLAAERQDVGQTKWTPTA